jgi:hypothetical protein
MFLKELVLRLNRTLWGQFLREICPFKKSDPKSGAVNGPITGILLSTGTYVKVHWHCDLPAQFNTVSAIQTNHSIAKAMYNTMNGGKLTIAIEILII